MIFYHRQETLQVFYSLLGLLFAVVAATMILAQALPQPSHHRQVVDAAGRLGAVTSESHVAKSDYQLLFQSTGSTIRVGGRRGLTSATMMKRLSYKFDPTPLNDHLHQHTTTTPTGSPTEIQDTSTVQKTVSSGGVDSRALTQATVPAVVIGISSTIILSASLLYCCHEARWNTRRTEPVETLNDAVNKDMAEINTSLGSTVEEGNGGFWITTESPNKSTLFPLLPADEEQPSTGSIAQVSTLIESVAGSSHLGNIVEKKLKEIDTSSKVMELSSGNIVSKDTSLRALVLMNYSDSVSLTSKEDDHDEDFEVLHGESCLDSDRKEQARPDPSFAYSPSNSSGSNGSLSKYCSPIRTREVEPGVPDDISVAASLAIRDIYHSPGAGQSPIGLDLITGDYPTVTKVYPWSPFLGRIFSGDSVLSINSVDMKNTTAGEAFDLMNGDNPIMITVKSTKNGGSSDVETHAASSDGVGAAHEV